MTQEIIQALAAAIVPIFFNWFKSRYGAANKQLKNQEFDSLSSIIDNGIQSKHRMTVEHLFNRFLKLKLSYDEIASILQMNSPLKTFSLYKSSQMFVKFSTKTKTFKFKKRYNSKACRDRFKTRRIIFYFIAAFIGSLTIMKSGSLLQQHGLEALPLIITIIVVSLPFAIIMLTEHLKIQDAEKFIKSTKIEIH